MRTQQLVMPLFFALFSLAGCQVQDLGNTSPNGEEHATDEARQLLDRIEQAYRNVQTLEVAGEISGEFDASGQRQQIRQKISGRYQAPNRFRHETIDEVLLGSTGEKVYMYNPVANAYFQTQLASEQKPLSQAMHGPIVELLQAQNPALYFAVVDDPVSQLMTNVESLRRLEDVRREGTSLLALELDLPGRERIVLLVDPESYFVQEVQMDLGTAAEPRESATRGTADLTIRYTSVVPGAKFPAGYFNWTPPPTAQDMGAEQARPAEGQNQSIAGKPAPDFTLPTLDGSKVSLSDVKGKIVVLDFWASWCPPCVESLPRLARLASELDEAPLAVYAVNVKEEPPTVQAFIRRLKVEMPILLDRHGDVAKQYRINSLPQTVVIGPDGKVKRVLVGAGAAAHAELRREIETLTEAAATSAEQRQP